MLPEAEIGADVMLLKDGAVVGGADGLCTGLSYQFVGDSHRVVCRVSACNVNHYFLLIVTRDVCSALHLQTTGTCIQTDVIYVLIQTVKKEATGGSVMSRLNVIKLS